MKLGLLAGNDKLDCARPALAIQVRDKKRARGLRDGRRSQDARRAQGEREAQDGERGPRRMHPGFGEAVRAAGQQAYVTGNSLI